MALTTNLPPQAYTRDTLVKAIEWLTTQPPYVREKAVSADLVVSYYLQACRKTAANIEAPVSGENFKSDLKHLAQDLKQFEEPFAPPPEMRFTSAVLTPEQMPPPAAAPASLRLEPKPREIFQSPEPIFKPDPAPRQEPPAKVISWPVDTRTLAAARDLQQRLNLGCEVEALRMLVTLGSERARTMFPPEA